MSLSLIRKVQFENVIFAKNIHIYSYTIVGCEYEATLSPVLSLLRPLQNHLLL